MTSKVLIADDSLTIQKVIGITLANSGYELVECLNEAELFRKIQSNHFDLILLDFNLSDSRSGYELAKQINNSMPGAAIIVMLGTFDTIDEGQFDACGIADKIVKPFESTKFIKKCRELLEGGRPTPVIEKKSIGSEETDIRENENDLDMWKVDAPVLNNNDQDDFSHDLEADIQTSKLDPLTSEIEGWGFTPSTQLEDKFQKIFPPTIEEASDVNILDRLQSSSTFVQDESLGFDDTDETDPSYVIPEDLNRDLLNEIEEDISADSFWAVDEIVPLKSEEESYIIETNLDEVTADLTETVHAFKQKEAASKVVESDEGDTIIHMDQDELVEKLKISLRPMIEEMVREFCKQHAEKVAWEVIPDLAENLIRKEIKEISKSIN